MSIPLLKRKEIYREALDKWGLPAQEGMLVEEIGEVLQAWNKRKRAVSYLGDHDIDFTLEGHLENYLEELADLHIILEQLEVAYGQTYRRIKRKKLDRLEKHLEEATA